LNVSVPEGVLAFHRLDDGDLRRWVAGAQHNTDDNSLLEFHAPRALLRHGLYEDNIEMVAKARTSPLPRDLSVEESRDTLLAAANTALLNNDWNRARSFLDGVTEANPSAFAELLRGRLDFGLENYAQAAEHYSAALRLDSSLTAAARGLAEVARHNDDLDSAYLLYRQILRREPQNLPAMAGVVKVLDRKHEWDQAAVWLSRKLDLDTDPDSSEFALLGDFFVETGHPKEAEAQYRKAIHRDAYSYAGHRGLGDLYRAQGQWEKARDNYEFAARFDPESSSEIFAALVDVYRHLGRERDARATLQKALRLFPGDAALAEVPRSP